MTLSKLIPLSQEQSDLLCQSAPPEATLVGGQALKWWADAYGLSFGNSASYITEDADFLGKRETLNQIQRAWGGRVLLMPERSLSALIGQVHKNVDASGNRHVSVDVIHRVFGLKTDEVMKQRVQISVDGHALYVLHPLHVTEARIKNLAGIRDKQTMHGALQTDLGIRVGRHYLRELAEGVREDPSQERKLLNALNRMAKLACDHQLQGAAKAWGLDLLDVFPVSDIPTQSFLDHQWPRIQAAAHSIAPSMTVGGPQARDRHTARRLR